MLIKEGIVSQDEESGPPCQPDVIARIVGLRNVLSLLSVAEEVEDDGCDQEQCQDYAHHSTRYRSGLCNAWKHTKHHKSEENSRSFQHKLYSNLLLKSI